MTGNVAVNARNIINDRGLKQRAVAKKAGMTDNKLSALLNGNAVMREQHIRAIAKALDLTADELMG